MRTLLARQIAAAKRRPLMALAVTVTVLAGAALRLFIARSSLGQLNADEAIVGLMARHVLLGEFPAFYWGQEYGGSLEAILAAPLLALAPTSIAAVKAVPQIFHVIGAVFCYLIGRRIATKEAGLFAGLLFWIWPAFSIWWSTKESGFYGVTLVTGLAAWLLALRIDEGPRHRDWLPLGLVAGQGWWASPQIVFLLVPLGLWLLLRRAVSWSGLAIATGSALVGAIPWIYANVKSDWASFIVPPVPTADPYPLRLSSFFVEAFPAFLGTRLQGEFGHWFLDPLGMVAFAMLIGVLAAALLLHGHLLVRIALFLYPFLYAISPLSRGEPRYLYLLAPMIVLLLATAIRSDLHRVIVIALAAVLSGANLVAMDRGAVGTPNAPDVAISGDLRDLAADLEREGVRNFYADYWIAYPVVFFSEERVIGTPFRGTLRNEDWANQVRAAQGSAYVLADGSETIGLVRTAYLSAGLAHDEIDLDGFLLIRSDVNVTPEAIPALQAPELEPELKARA